MARIKVMIIDGSGNEITTHDYALESELLNLSKIESTVENLRPQILGNITKDLLMEEQTSFKKRERTENGSKNYLKLTDSVSFRSGT